MPKTILTNLARTQTMPIAEAIVLRRIDGVERPQMLDVEAMIKLADAAAKMDVVNGQVEEIRDMALNVFLK